MQMSDTVHVLRQCRSLRGALVGRPRRCSFQPFASHAQDQRPVQRYAAPANPNVPAGTARREALGAMLLSGAALLLGGDLAAPRAAPAKVSIASVEKGGEGERDVEVTASGIRMSLVSAGHGDPPAAGSVVLMDVVGRLADGSVFLDTRAEGAAPLAFQLGTTNKLVTEGLAQVVETMRSGDVKLAAVPPSLGYGAAGATFKSGRRVPPNAPLLYEVSLLRCQTFSLGMACCADADFPCIKKQPQEAAPQGQPAPAGGAP